MAKYRITSPDGNSYEVTAPDTASQDEVLNYAKQNYQKPSLPKRALAGYMGFMGKEGSYGSNPAGKFMSMLQAPFQKAGQAVTEQMGKRQMNPYLSAGVGTAIQMAPDIALAAGPGASPQTEPGEFAKGLMGQMESASGGMKGSLESQFKNPSLMFSKGTGSAKPFYQAATKELPFEQTIFKGLIKHGEIVDKAVETIEKGGKLEPQEALIARKSLDKVRKTLSDDSFSYYRKTLDSVAKSNPNIASADPLHLRGMMSQSLRQLLPQNKYGGASAFKMGIAPALSGLGGFVGGPIGAGFGAGTAAATLSPAVQGAVVGGAGALSKIDPRLITAAILALRRKRENPNPQ